VQAFYTTRRLEVKLFILECARNERRSRRFYESLGTTVFPKLQILTIKGLLDGTKTARYPDLTRGGLTFKKAKKEKTEEQLTFGKYEPHFDDESLR